MGFVGRVRIVNGFQFDRSVVCWHCREIPVVINANCLGCVPEAPEWNVPVSGCSCVQGSRKGYTGSGDIQPDTRNVLLRLVTFGRFVQSEPYLPHSVSLKSPEWVVLPVMDKPSRRRVFINRHS